MSVTTRSSITEIEQSLTIVTTKGKEICLTPPGKSTYGIDAVTTIEYTPMSALFEVTTSKTWVTELKDMKGG